MFPIINSYATKDIVVALQKYSGVFIKDISISIMGRLSYELSVDLMTNDLPTLDRYTMFPTSVTTLPGANRKVIQRYVNRLFEFRNDKLSELLSQLSNETENLSNQIILESGKIFEWSKDTINNLLVKNEWVLNIAQYEFTAGNSQQLLFPSHKDWGLFAIYPYVHGNGLEVYINKEWQSVIVPEDCTFCYCGDIFNKITDGQMPALTHRVIQPSDEGSRTSIIFYVDPIREMLVRGTTVGSLIESRLRRIGQI